MPNIVVLGAGVSGLTSAYLLSQDKTNKITVLAKHMPGDYDPEYASPYAGANVLPSQNVHQRKQSLGDADVAGTAQAGEGGAGSRHSRDEQVQEFITVCPLASDRSLTESRVLRRAKDLEKLKKGGYSFDGLFLEDPWYKSLFDDFRELSKEELPAGVASGCEFGSVCINTMLYLPWLVGKCRENGVVFKRANLKHISEASAAAGHKVDVVVNASGLMAGKLGGVMDGKMVPVRGQLVVVRNEAPYMVTKSGTDDADDELFYMMMRANGGGTILGGTYQKGQWESQPDPNIAMRIMRRAVEMVPELTGGKGVQGLDIIRHAVGLRPYREGGVRLEKEKIDGTWVVHNYGHAGWGYQGSYGCAERVVELVGEIQTPSKL